MANRKPVIQENAEGDYARFLASLSAQDIGCPFDDGTWQTLTERKDVVYVDEDPTGWVGKHARQPYEHTARDLVVFPKEHRTNPLELLAPSWNRLLTVLTSTIGEDGAPPTAIIRYSLIGQHELTDASIRHIHAHVINPTATERAIVPIGRRVLGNEAELVLPSEFMCPIADVFGQSTLAKTKGMGRLATGINVYTLNADPAYTLPPNHFVTSRVDATHAAMGSALVSLFGLAAEQRMYNGALMLQFQRDQESADLSVHAHLVQAPAKDTQRFWIHVEQL